MGKPILQFFGSRIMHPNILQLVTLSKESDSHACISSISMESFIISTQQAREGEDVNFQSLEMS